MYNINNKIKQSPICCIYCGKSYKVRANLKKHEITCELINGDKRTDIELPTYNELFLMVVNLTNKYSKLEQQVNKLNNNSINKTIKVNFLDWLNRFKKPDIDSKSFNNNIIIYSKYIDLLFNNSVYDTIQIILNDHFNLSNVKIIPIYAFNEKKNIIYGYNEKQTWEILSDNELTRLFGSILILLSKELDSWYKNIDLLTVDKKQDIYNKNKIKIVSPNLQKTSILSRFKTILYNIIKVEMKERIYYEVDINL